MANSYRDCLRACLQAGRPLCRPWLVDQIPGKDCWIIRVLHSCDGVGTSDYLLDMVLVQGNGGCVNEEIVGEISPSGPHSVLQQHPTLAQYRLTRAAVVKSSNGQGFAAGLYRRGAHVVSAVGLLPVVCEHCNKLHAVLTSTVNNVIECLQRSLVVDTCAGDLKSGKPTRRTG